MDKRGVFTPLSDMAAKNGHAKANGQPGRTTSTAAAKAEAGSAKRMGQVQFKAMHGIILAFFTLISILHVFGVYLFASGFLLTRLVLPHRSHCSLPPIQSAHSYTAGSVENGCWHPKTFKRAVVVIVDALRYDFTVPLDKQSRPVTPSASPQQQRQLVTPRHFHDALPILYETASRQPSHAFLLPFIADPPTTTLQRLKGLTTGTLPTFIDAGSNFAGTAIEEDNLIAHLRNAGKRLVHLGDDTWHALFPQHFEPNLTRAYDSFNVYDLHTVDHGVTHHLFPLLHPTNTSRWDVIFGHYLGVDHAGHRYGPDHAAMKAKLNEMNAVVTRIKEAVDDDTLLVVMGDHGMDAKGDHGGETEDEIQAALWMYSKKAVFGRTDAAYTLPPPSAKIRPVAQIDLVPTLALLLGIPIPFNNLGRPIEEAFIGPAGTDYRNLATVNRLTAAQIHRYQDEYVKARGQEDSITSTSSQLWAQANHGWKEAGSNAKAEQLQELSNAFSSYQRHTLAICRARWARFDAPRMLSGILILVSSVVVLFLYAASLRGDGSEPTPVFFTRGALGLVSGGLLGVAASFALPNERREHVIVLFCALFGLIGTASTFYSLSHCLTSPLPSSVWGWASVTFTLSLAAGFAANSFTIWEDEILLYLLITFGLLALVSSFKQRHGKDRTLGIYHSILFTVLARVASFSRICREEQLPYCKPTYYASALSTTSAHWQLAIPVIAALVMPSLLQGYFEGTKNYRHNAKLWIGTALRSGLALSALYWLLDAADDGDWYPGWGDAVQMAKRMVAQMVLAISLAFGYAIYNCSKPLVHIIVNEPTTDAGSAPKEAVTVLGYANVHGSRYALLVTIWYLAVALLQKPMGAGATSILVWQLFSLFEIVHTNNLRQSSIGPVVLGLLASFHFFKTGHQATLQSIQWKAAFIPLATIRYPWTPMVLVLSTFGAHVLCAIAVPALVLWKVGPQKKGLLGMLAKATATHLLFYATINLATTVWAGHLRRHLMLYRIFMPRFLLGAVVLLLVDLAAILISLWGARMSMLSVAEVFGFGG